MIRLPSQSVWLLGGNVAASQSPEVQTAIYQRWQLPWHYALCSLEANRVREMLRSLWRIQAIGCNITAPYKELVSQYLQSRTDGDIQLNLSAQAQRLGSVNTVKIRPEGLYGYSTDGPGWWRAFSQQFAVRSLSGRTVLLLGAGGAARALLGSLLEHGAERVFVINRTPQHAQNMLSALDDQQRCQYLGPHWQGQLPDGSVIVQATSCRSAKDLAELFNWQGLSSGVIACDLLYGETPSAFMRQAAALGLPRQDGMGMLRCQAELAVQIWKESSPWEC